MNTFRDLIRLIEDIESPPEDSTVNPKDKVTIDIPLLIRLFEYAREDANTDMDLHDLTEKMISMGSEPDKVLTMSDYKDLIKKSTHGSENYES